MGNEPNLSCNMPINAGVPGIPMDFPLVDAEIKSIGLPSEFRNKDSVAELGAVSLASNVEIFSFD